MTGQSSCGTTRSATSSSAGCPKSSRSGNNCCNLPDRGWDAVIERGFAAQRRGIPATAVSLLEARLVPDQLGGGRSRAMLEAMGLI